MIAAAPHILLVEDNPADAGVILDSLSIESRGEQVTHKICLNDALAYLSASEIDVVLLDLHLPDGIGVSCVEALRRRAPEVPVVVLTGIDDEQVAHACLEAGAQDYLSKMEMHPRQLRRTIGYALARSRERAERVRAEALRLHLAAIVESSHDGIVSCDPEGSILTWNRGAALIFGFTAEEAIGRSLHNVVRPLVPNGEGRAGHASVPVSADDLTRRRRDDTIVHLSVVACDLLDPDGTIRGVAGIYRDVTAHKLRDQELRRRNEELLLRDAQMRALATRLTSVREEERTRISRAVHDELGQLLTGLKMDIKWIERHLAPPNDNSPDIRLRLEAAAQLADETMQTVHRIASELRPSALDALGLVAAIKDEARRFEQRSGVVTEVQVQGEGQPQSDVATALFRVLQELLTNVARHARATNATVVLTARQGDWILRVTDDGSGIPPGAEARTDSLGLLGIRERAAALGGTVSVNRGPQQGTVVTIQVPEHVAPGS